jgi:peptidoglycan biosynthesis protein MviN/MurJ (putative lipid II flippase)
VKQQDSAEEEYTARVLLKELFWGAAYLLLIMRQNLSEAIFNAIKRFFSSSFIPEILKLSTLVIIQILQY